MANFEFVGPDAIDHFWLGRVTPGDIVEADEQPGADWKPTKKRPSRAPSAEQPPADAEHGPAAPENAKEA